ncbi:hypothetical protein HNY73_011508 [Argiope bruennichi]|uniref:Uncharacterized protein n=1 Tax=Argiope bruennichi TaxID=94029 RepID=A0A8T0F6J6_ARGBR|nr:hypothetical protein HNY73_011508 [Argiope bruennichi]
MEKNKTQKAKELNRIRGRIKAKLTSIKKFVESSSTVEEENKFILSCQQKLAIVEEIKNELEILFKDYLEIDEDGTLSQKCDQEILDIEEERNELELSNGTKSTVISNWFIKSKSGFNTKFLKKNCFIAVSSSIPTESHIYCQPPPVRNLYNCPHNNNTEKPTDIQNDMTTNQVSSTIVPIDVSGQPFNRMATFRRSLIHVDFFNRRKKKKEKRRNTVAEGDTKELKDVLHNIINEGNASEQSWQHGLLRKIFLRLNVMTLIKSAAMSKRRLKSHIPISTVSAAMNVAVEMRQLNSHRKIEDQSSSGNWSYSSDINSSDSENKTNSNENNRYATKDTDMKNVDSSVSNNKANNRFKAKFTESEEYNPNMVKENKETEISNYTILNNNATHNDETSNGTSAEYDVFLISSDESDDSSDIIFENNYGSSLSVYTISDGSLNSLLSQTGTEMTSSSGTLTSIGFEPLPLPPPPPPATIAATIKDAAEKINLPVALDSDCSIQKQVENDLKNNRKETNKPRIKQELIKKNKPQQKSSKSRKTEKADSFKHPTENQRNLFSTLINIKSRTKEQNKFKNSHNKLNKLQNHPHINMYGNSSPKNVKPLPLFLKENISPIKGNESKNYLKSFSTNQTKLKSEIQLENKFRFKDQEFQTQVKSDTSMYKTHPNTYDIKDSYMNKMELPLKYAHKVTVTPIQRRTMNERNNSLALCKKTLFKEDSDQQLTTEFSNNFKYASNREYLSDLNNSEFFCKEKPKSQNPMTLQPKQAARVLLDPEGRVIHCTNSLDRRLYTIPPKSYANNINNSKSNNWAAKRVITKTEETINDLYTNQIQHHLISVNTTQSLNDPHFIASSVPNSNTVAHVERYHSKELEIERGYHKNPISLQKNATENVSSRASIGANLIRTPFSEPIHNQNNPNERVNTNSFQKTPTVITPDPNISGLPVNENTLTKHNIDLHSKRMEQLCGSQREKNNHSLTKNSYSQICPQGHVNKSHHSTMSTEDLFAVIHNCKKRMNIKTDSDISIAFSSRSCSPSYLRPAPSKGALAETGFLSPRNTSSFDCSRDRRSWADFRSTNSATSERKSLASDRFGPTKPTSMHDFKMLLLQARSNSQTLGPRKSAVEMLKIPSPLDKAPRITSAPISLSPCSSVAYSVPSSPSSNLYLHNGHSTVPFKRNNRARCSLQSRYTMYPPIFEDCSEDSENTHDTLQHYSEINASYSEEINTSAQVQHTVNNVSGDHTVHDVRIWL